MSTDGDSSELRGTLSLDSSVEVVSVSLASTTSSSTISSTVTGGLYVESIPFSYSKIDKLLNPNFSNSYSLPKASSIVK